MHEFSLCQGLVSALKEQPFRKEGRVLQRIEVSVGPLAGVELELLRHAYPLVTKDTPFERVAMLIRDTDIIVKCIDCKTNSEVKINDLRCPKCNSEATQVVQGNECALTHLFYGEEEYV